MGKSITPTYIVIYTEDGKQQSQAWECKYSGRPTDKNLEKWRKLANESYKEHGCNYHLSLAAGKILSITTARVVRQSNTETMAFIS